MTSPPKQKSSVPAPARAVLPVFPRTQVQGAQTAKTAARPAAQAPPTPRREAPRRPAGGRAPRFPEWDNLTPQDKEALITLFSDDPPPAEDTPRGRFSWEYERKKRENAKMREEAMQRIYGYSRRRS